MSEQRIECPNDHRLFALFSEHGIAFKCRTCKQETVYTWEELETRRKEAKVQRESVLSVQNI